MYKKEHDLPKKNIIGLKQGNIQFEENDENQHQFLAKLQERVEKYKPEKNQTNMDNYYKYITGIFSLLASGPERSEIQTKIKSPKLDYFKTYWASLFVSSHNFNYFCIFDRSVASPEFGNKSLRSIT